MTVEYTEHPDANMVEIVVDGKVTQADYDDLVPRMEAFMAEHDKIKILEVVNNFKGFDPSMLLEGIKFDFRHLTHYSHCAVVSDYGWLGPLARMMSPLLSMELRTFRRDEEQQARAWLEAA